MAVPPWIAAMDATMVRPSPKPSWEVRSLSRWNGWKIRPASARGHGELVVIPPQAWAGGLAAAVIIGALAGLLPAIRAARLSPTQALWSI